MLRAKTKEQKQRVLEIFGIQETCCHFPLGWKDEELNDQVYIDGNISFDKMAETVDYLRSENKPKKGALDMSIVAPEMQEAVEKWLAYKKEKKQSYKPSGFISFYNRICELSGNNPQIAMAIVEQSKSNNYAGIFPLKTNNNIYGTRTQSEKLRDTVIHANEFSQMLHNRVEQQATMGDGDSEEIRRLQDIL